MATLVELQPAMKHTETAQSNLVSPDECTERDSLFGPGKKPIGGRLRSNKLRQLDHRFLIPITSLHFLRVFGGSQGRVDRLMASGLTSAPVQLWQRLDDPCPFGN